MRRIDRAEVAVLGMAAGLCGLGVLSVIYRDFALQWEPVPKSLPFHDALGAASGALLLAAGLAMTVRATRVWGAGAAAAFLAFWAFGLHLPHALGAPLDPAVWNGVAEPLAMATGAYVACREARRETATAGRAPAYVLGLCFIAFGAAHFGYAKFTASMIPDWLPMRVPLAYLTGAIHAGTGLALLLGVQRRWAAAVEALMMTSFVLLVHIPRVAVHPTVRIELTMLFIAIALSSAVWIFATSRTARGGGTSHG